MKRIALVMLVGALLLAMIGGVAGAATFICTDKPCYGTNNNDQIGERDGSVSDEIHARAGGDTVNAKRFGNDTDKVYGQDGADKINTDDGDGKDLANGGPGNDTCITDPGDVKQSC